MAGRGVGSAQEQRGGRDVRRGLLQWLLAVSETGTSGVGVLDGALREVTMSMRREPARGHYETNGTRCLVCLRPVAEHEPDESPTCAEVWRAGIYGTAQEVEEMAMRLREKGEGDPE